MLKLYWKHITNLAQVELQSQYLKVVDNRNVKSLCTKMILIWKEDRQDCRITYFFYLIS